MKEPLILKNKSIDGYERIAPYNLSLQTDNYQVQANQVCFDIDSVMGRAFIPDGMDVIQYKILAGNTVTMCFWYKQKTLKKQLFNEAKTNKIL